MCEKLNQFTRKIFKCSCNVQGVSTVPYTLKGCCYTVTKLYDILTSKHGFYTYGQDLDILMSMFTFPQKKWEILKNYKQ